MKVKLTEQTGNNSAGAELDVSAAEGMSLLRRGMAVEVKDAPAAPAAPAGPPQFIQQPSTADTVAALAERVKALEEWREAASTPANEPLADPPDDAAPVAPRAQHRGMRRPPQDKSMAAADLTTKGA